MQRIHKVFREGREPSKRALTENCHFFGFGELQLDINK